MKQILILCFLLISVTGDKEHSQLSPGSDSLSKLLDDSSLSELLNDPDLWLILKKRLGNGDIRDECIADKRRNSTIIKTKDSMDAGATFIASPTVGSERDCETECCKTKTCNTAIIKAKGGANQEIACYLFDCKSPSICVFTIHQGFTVLDFTRSPASDEHVNELDHLAVSSAATLPSSTTTVSSTTTASPTTALRPGRIQGGGGTKSAGLFGVCLQAGDCHDDNTDCLSGYCVCQQGYHVVDMHCRKECNKELEFECSNKGFPLRSECIAVYDYCDGTIQCSDGSDEVNCKDERHGMENHGNGDSHVSHPVTPKDNAMTVSPTAEVLSPKLNSPTKSPLNPVSQPVNNNASPANVDPHHETAKTSGPLVSNPTHHDLPTVEKKQETLPDTNNEVHQEKVVQYFWRMETNRGAVVALILGIILTTMLLILAACRLRHYRKRYRKGRHMNSNDADYLINGMYL